MADEHEPGPVEAGVARELAPLPEELRESGLAATALAMAREIDDPSNSATSKSMCGRTLANALETLRGLAPPKQEVDKVHALAASRAERRGRGSRTPRQARS